MHPMHHMPHRPAVLRDARNTGLSQPCARQRLWHPCRLGFGIGMVGFLPMLLIVLGLKADAFFPELGGTFVVTVAASIGLALAVVAPIVWLRFLKSEDAQQDAWEEEDRRNREYLAARHREQDGNYGRHAAMR